MLQTYKKIFRFIVKKNIVSIILITFISIILFYHENYSQNDFLIVKDNKVIGLKWHDNPKWHLGLNTKYDNKNLISKDLDIRGKKEHVKKEASHDSNELKHGEIAYQEKLHDVNIAIENIVKEAKDENNYVNGVYKLPQFLDDVSLEWKREKQTFKLWPLFILPLFVVIFIFDYINKKKNINLEKDESIIRGLPRFLNQLLILLNSGVIFEDAISYISNMYQREELSYFEELICSSVIEADERNMATIRVLEEKCKFHHNQHLMRMISILKNSQFMGTDLRSQLSEESLLLWELRKRNAIELSKKAEVKLSFPMALLLISILLITGAPAILQVNGM